MCFLNGMKLKTVGREKDLGIIVDRELKFHEQTAAAGTKASQLLAVVKRCFAHFDEHTLPLIYKALIRPHLEYGNVVWGPFRKLDQRRLEGVQRQATKLVRHLRTKPYEETPGSRAPVTVLQTQTRQHDRSVPDCTWKHVSGLERSPDQVNFPSNKGPRIEAEQAQGENSKAMHSVAELWTTGTRFQRL